LVAVTDIAEQGDQGLHPGVVAGLDITFCIANIETVFCRYIDMPAGMQHGFGMRLAITGAVSAYDTGGAWLQFQLEHQRFRQPCGFVGHDTPFHAALFNIIEQGCHSGK
jgi:hypothetical protein